MYGFGVLKTLGIAFYHFVLTYVDDVKMGFGKRYTPKHLPERQGVEGRGIYTVRYPQEKLPLPERSRNHPFLVYIEETGKLKCTACGICAQACPVQCIWIERGRNPETGKPASFPAAFHIDQGLCIGCGMCAEFCPFDAIKMDMEYENSSYTRPGFVGIEELKKPESYHAKIHPTDYAREMEEKRLKEERKRKAAAAKAAKAKAAAAKKAAEKKEKGEGPKA